MSGPECQPRRASVPWGLLGMIGLVLAINVSFLNDRSVWVRFQSATTIAVRSRQSLTLAPPCSVTPPP